MERRGSESHGHERGSRRREGGADIATVPGAVHHRKGRAFTFVHMERPFAARMRTVRQISSPALLSPARLSLEIDEGHGGFCGHP